MTFRVLQLGAGTRGRMWGKVAKMSDDVLTAAIVDPSQASLDLYSAENPETPAFTDLESALSSGQFDAAILVTPPDGHLQQMRRLFDAGLPILAEKPLATTLKDAAAIVEMADAARLLSACKSDHASVADGRKAGAGGFRSVQLPHQSQR
jgi:predicted dehydrogenase